MRKTKIVCTLGPSTDDIEVLKEMMLSGMDVARLNFSHGTHEQHKKRIDNIKKLRSELNLPVAIMLDNKGPGIRIGAFKGGRVELYKGDLFILTAEDIIGNKERVSITYKDLKDKVAPGNDIFIDDGIIQLKVVEIAGDDIVCKVISPGVVTDKKSINVPGIKLDMPYLNQTDIDDIVFGIENDVDFIAASFVRSAADIIEIKRVLEQYGGRDIQIIAKIENSQGVENIDEILKISDGIMVARGDMGIEIPFEELPRIQKMLIKKAYMSGKKAITATQMLDSMEKNPRPTRAETTDVANAVYDGTSAIMLSGETAAGKYPVLALKTMCKIALRAEEDIDYEKRFRAYEVETKNVANAISHATVTTAHDLNAAAIVTVTKTGTTARMISKYRPNCPIVGCTTSEKVRRQLNMSWGVLPVLIEEKDNTDELFDYAVEKALETGIIKIGDLVAITSGVPLGVPGTTNTLKVHLVGHILVSGKGINKKTAVGKLCVCKNEQQARENFEEGDILVLPETSNDIIDLLKKAGGIITETDGYSSHAAVVGLSLDIPVVCGAKYATDILKSGTTVTIDGARGLVYCGAMDKI